MMQKEYLDQVVDTYNVLWIKSSSYQTILLTPLMIMISLVQTGKRAM